MESTGILKSVKDIGNSGSTRDKKLLNICKLLNESIEYYNWVGFYFANHESKTLCVLFADR